MKTNMLLNLLMMTVGALMSVSSFAQEHVGNGGGSHFCKDRSFQESYDIYEGRTRYRLKFDETQTSEKEVLTKVLHVIKNYDVTLYQEVANWINYLNSTDRFVVQPKIKLTKISDANILLTDEGCEYEQLANWDEVSGRVFVKEGIYTKLNPFHQAALKLHEVIYKVYRSRKNANNSDQTRRLVAELLSIDPNTYLLKDLVESNDLMSSENPKELVFGISAPVFSHYETATQYLDLHLGNYDLTDNQNKIKVVTSIETITSIFDDVKKSAAAVKEKEDLLNNVRGKSRRAKMEKELKLMNYYHNQLKTLSSCFNAGVRTSEKSLTLKNESAWLSLDLMNWCSEDVGVYVNTHFKVIYSLLRNEETIAKVEHDIAFNNVLTRTPVILRLKGPVTQNP